MSDNTASFGLTMLVAAAPGRPQGVFSVKWQASTGQSEKAAGDAETRARARDNQPVTNEVTNQLPKRWSDDPWCNMTTGEAEAWRRGWEEAKLQAMRAALQIPIPEECCAAEAHGRLMGSLDALSAIAAMEPPK